jgi:hypothetical protein
MKFQVYTHFGRVLHEFKVYEDELHHRASSEAQMKVVQLRKEGTMCWVRLVRGDKHKRDKSHGRTDV